jgi:hypothetical protein
MVLHCPQGCSRNHADAEAAREGNLINPLRRDRVIGRITRYLNSGAKGGFRQQSFEVFQTKTRPGLVGGSVTERVGE